MLLFRLPQTRAGVPSFLASSETPQALASALFYMIRQTHHSIVVVEPQMLSVDLPHDAIARPPQTVEHRQQGEGFRLGLRFTFRRHREGTLHRDVGADEPLYSETQGTVRVLASGP